MFMKSSDVFVHCTARKPACIMHVPGERTLSFLSAHEYDLTVLQIQCKLQVRL
jgi:hypothetical protein